MLSTPTLSMKKTRASTVISAFLTNRSMTYPVRGMGRLYLSAASRPALATMDTWVVRVTYVHPATSSVEMAPSVSAPDATPAAIIDGAEDSIAYDEWTQLRALDPAADQNLAASADAPLVKGSWKIVHGYGCLAPTIDNDTCLTELNTENAPVEFTVKAMPDFVNMTGIQFVPASGAPPLNFSVVTQPVKSIPINGFGRPQLKPFLDNLTAFMKSRSYWGGGTRRCLLRQARWRVGFG